MAKERNRGNREAKKPKANKKPTTVSGPSLRPQQAPPPPATRQKSTTER